LKKMRIESLECSYPGKLSASNQGVDLIGTFSGLSSFHVNHSFDCHVLPEKTVSSLNLSCGPNDRSRSSCAESLDHGNLAHCCLALLVVKGRSHKQLKRCLDISQHVDKLLLGQLEAGDRATEGHPLEGVFVGRFVGSSHTSNEHISDG